MAKRIVKGEEAIEKARAKARMRRVELRMWYEGGKLRKRIVAIGKEGD